MDIVDLVLAGASDPKTVPVYLVIHNVRILLGFIPLGDKPNINSEKRSTMLLLRVYADQIEEELARSGEIL